MATRTFREREKKTTTTKSSEKKKVNRNTNIFSTKRVNRKIKEVSRFSVQNNDKEIYKKVCCTRKFFFFAN